MDQEQILLSLFTSKVRLKLLASFFVNPEERHYVRELVRKTQEEINAVRRELKRLNKIGLLRSEHRQNRLYYSVRRDFPFYAELIRMVAKITGVGKEILQHAHLMGQIRYAMFALPFFCGRMAKKNEVDLLLVGTVDLTHLKQIIHKAEEQLGKEINYSVMSEEELIFRKKRRDPFILGVLAQPQILLIGGELELNK